MGIQPTYMQLTCTNTSLHHGPVHVEVEATVLAIRDAMPGQNPNGMDKGKSIGCDGKMSGLIMEHIQCP